MSQQLTPQPQKQNDIFEMISSEKWSAISQNRKYVIYSFAAVSIVILALALSAGTFWVWLFLLLFAWAGLLVIYPRTRGGARIQENLYSPQIQGNWYQKLSGGETWSDMSWKRKGCLIWLVLSVALGLPVAIAMSVPQTDQFGNTTPGNGGDFIGWLFWLGVLIFAVTLWPRRKRRDQGVSDYRPVSSPQEQSRPRYVPPTPAIQQPKDERILGVPVSKQTTALPESGEVLAGRRCSFCGTENGRYAIVCKMCGKSLTSQPEQATPLAAIAGKPTIELTGRETDPQDVPVEEVVGFSTLTAPAPAPLGSTLVIDNAPEIPPQPTVSRDEVRHSALGKDMQSGEIIALPQAARRQGLYIIGANGTGKSTLIANLIAQDMEQGIGVCLLDPHGDLTTQVLARVPDKRIEDVILLDLMDSGYPFGLNLFECPKPDDLEQVALTASFVMHVFAKVWNVGTETPLLAQVLRNCTFTLIQNPGTTLAEIPLLLSDETARNKLVGNVKNSQVRLFWTQYGKMKQHDQMERTSSTLNKVDAFLTQPIIANIVSQSHTTLDFRKIMDEGKILLVQLNPRLEDISSLVGSVVIGQILNAALSRKELPEEQRRQFHLYADEYQRYATEDFATLLSEARKFGVATTIAHQTRSQLDYANKGVTVNAANIIVFRVTGEDAGELAKEFDATPPPPEVIGQRPVLVPKQDSIKHLIETGHPNPNTMAIQRYLQMLKEITGEAVHVPRLMGGGTGILDTGIMFIRNQRAVGRYQKEKQLHDEIKIMLHDLNQWFYQGMSTRDWQPPLPAPILLTSAQVFEADKLLRPFNDHHREIELLCSPMVEDWDKAKTTLVRPDRADQEDQFKRLYNFLHTLRLTFASLCEEPILVDSGRWEPMYDKPRTYADVQNEIATKLANLKNYTARVKTVGQPEHTIQTLLPTKGVSGVEFDTRRSDILTQTRLGYCRPRSEVEQEVIARQEKLMQKDDDQPKRFE